MNLDNNQFIETRMPWIIFLAGMIVFAGSMDFNSNGDVLYYANIIDTSSFDRLTTHQGYYLIGYIFKQAFGPLSGLTTDQTLVVMNTLFGAGALAVGYLLLKHYLDDIYDAMLGTLMLLLCHRFFVNATSAEVYIVQTFFIWSSYLLFEKRRFYSAGTSIAIALWVSPLSGAYVLVFPAVAWLRGFGILPLVRMSIPVALIYLPFLHYCYKELFWGVRGLLDQDGRREVMLLDASRDFFRFQVKHYSFLNVLIFPALAAIRHYRHVLIVTVVAVLPNIYVISQLRGEDNVFILSMDIFIVCWFVIGWRYLRERSLAPVAALLLVLHLYVFLVSEQPFVGDTNINYMDDMKAIGDIVRQDEDPALFMDWSRRMAFVYYNRDSAFYPLEEGEWYNMVYDSSNLLDEENKDKDNDVGMTYERDYFDDLEEIYVLETYEESAQAQLFIDDQSLAQRFEENSGRRRIERFLDTECKEVRPGLYTLYRCR